MPAQNFVLHVYSSLKQILGRIERHSVVKHPLTDTGYRTGSGGTEKSDNTRSKSYAKPGFSGIEIKLEQVRYIPVYSRAARELYCTNVHIYSIGKIKWSLTVAVPIFDDSDLLNDLFVIPATLWVVGLSDFLKSGILWGKMASLHVTKYDGSAARFLSGSSDVHSRALCPYPLFKLLLTGISRWQAIRITISEYTAVYEDCQY